MTTRQPRVAVTLTPSTRSLITDIAALTGRSHSAIVSELVESAAPALQTMAEALRVVQEQPMQAQRLLSRYANEAVGELAQAQLALDDALDRRTMDSKIRSPRGRAKG
jgi:uncharacterized protein (DUF1778 family)